MKVTSDAPKGGGRAGRRVPPPARRSGTPTSVAPATPGRADAGLTMRALLVGCLGLVALGTAACTAAGPDAATPVTGTTPSAGVAPEAPSSAAGMAAVAGRYRLRSPDYEEDYDRAITQDYYLELRADGTVEYTAEELASGTTSVVAQGTWVLDGTSAIVQITELSGMHAATPEQLRYEYKDGFPVVTSYSAGDVLHSIEEAEFTLGAGERHPLVAELHRRLAAIDYLGFTDPGDDLYTETTRKAVVAFQDAHGLLPNGQVDPATWVLLGRPPPPVPTETPAPPPTVVAATPGIPRLDDLPKRTDDGKPIVYLTFDDGPTTYTAQILDLLARYDAKATFFVLGNRAEVSPDLLRAEARAGHLVANHTYSHPSLAGVSWDDFFREVDGTKQIILGIALDLLTLDPDVRYLRPPYGATDAYTREYAAALGYAVVLWDVDPQDWRRPGADVIAGHIDRSVYPGAIVLMHDGGGERSQSVAALGTVLHDLSAQGYEFRNIFVP